MKQKPQYKQVALLFLFLGLFCTMTNGQARIDSPYSRFGLGDIDPGYNAYQSSMGGVAYGIFDSLRINTLNPASYANIGSKKFLFNAGFNSLFLNTHTENQSGKTSYANLTYLKMAFPITKRWKSSIGLMPYSKVGYKVSTYSELDSVGMVKYSSIGDGGLSKLFWGNAFKISKNFDLGINASYFFGNVNYTRENQMLDLPDAFKYKITNTTSVKSLHFDFGLQYHATFGKTRSNTNDKYFIGIGIVYSPEQTLNSKQSTLANTFTESSSGFTYIKDTIVNLDQGSGTITIPQKIGGGFSFGEKNKWMIAADYTIDHWSNFEVHGENKNFYDSKRYNIGGQYYIGKYALNGGFRYHDSYLELNETKINEYGISFGVALPLRSISGSSPTSAILDLGFEFGRRGTTKNQLIQQDYFKFKLGINICNTWFQRTKYL